jgi:hypothetical protein
LLINPPDDAVLAGQVVLIAMGDIKDIHRARLEAGP